ncbi:Lrp/AsnC family transcriptional regulator [Conexivisphaera calida]|uniref:Lrp/AsnC family transcriptional regulator n=1 Tax=Conexivisphaera calida TaxID=1874277 RepID=UPI001E3DEB6E|nr:Lrp/AsnC family transcriptional regulator [Conexivisphaera calida]
MNDRGPVLDELDYKILKLLEEDCTLTYKEVAEKVNRSLWTVRDRIELMKMNGIVRGCKAVLDYRKMGYMCKGILFFNIPAEYIERAIEFMKSQEVIKSIMIISGDRRFAVTIVGRDASEVRNYVLKNLTKFKIYNTELDCVLEEYV